MDQFEQQFEQLDLQSNVMEQTMTSATTTVQQTDEVEALMAQIADEAGLEKMANLESVPIQQQQEEQVEEKAEENPLQARLEKLMH